MTKSNPADDKGAKGAKATTDKAAAAPSGKPTHQVTEGTQISIRGVLYGAGHRVSAADFVTKRDPDGKAGLQRLVDGGELAKLGGKAAKVEEEDDAKRAALTDSANNGAGPSAAQIAAAEAGNDPAATSVVKALLSATTAELEAAANPDAPKA